MEWRRGEYLITNDPARVDLDVVHGFLVESYWAKDIPRDIVRRSIEKSLPFSLLNGERQVGFARIVTDCATVAYVGDVFVLPEHRGRGLSAWLMECVAAHPDLQGLRRWILLTRRAWALREDRIHSAGGAGALDGAPRPGRVLAGALSRLVCNSRPRGEVPERGAHVLFEGPLGNRRAMLDRAARFRGAESQLV
jgi:GNAT superfamily N-acetyltransferase